MNEWVILAARRVFSSGLGWEDKWTAVREGWQELCQKVPSPETRISYLELLGVREPYFALALIHTAEQADLPEEHRSLMKERIRERVAQEVEGLTAVIPMDTDYVLEVTRRYCNAFLYRNSVQKIIPPLPDVMRRSAVWTASAVLLGDPELLRRALEQMAALNKECAGGDLAIVSKRIGRQGRLEPRFSLIACSVLAVEELLHFLPDAAAQMNTLHAACGAVFPPRWHESALAYEYGCFRPQSGKAPQEMLALARQAIQDGRERYADLLLKPYQAPTLEELGMDLQSLMERLFTTTGDQFYRGALLVERLLMASADTPLSGLEQWWNAMETTEPRDNAGWVQMEHWFRMYWICRHAILDPEHANRFLRKLETLPEVTYYKGYYASLCRIQEEAFDTLLAVSGRGALQLVRVLGGSNVFAIRENGPKLPLQDSNPERESAKTVLERMLDQKLSTEEIISVFLNTRLRSEMSLGGLLTTLGRTGRRFGGDQRNQYGGRYYVGYLFQDYPLYGCLSSLGRNEYAILSFNVHNCDREFICLTGRWQNPEICREVLARGNSIRFQPQWWDINRCVLHAAIVEEDWMKPVWEASNQRFLEELEKIASQRSFDSAQELSLSRLAWDITTASPEMQRTFALRVVQCCAALSGDRQQIRSFLLLVNKKGNEFRYRNGWKPGKNYQFLHKPSFSLEENQILRQAWTEMERSEMKRSQLFFIWVNTVLRSTIPLSWWAERDSVITQEEMQSVMTENNRYCFVGRTRYQRLGQSQDTDPAPDQDQDQDQGQSPDQNSDKNQAQSQQLDQNLNQGEDEDVAGEEAEAVVLIDLDGFCRRNPDGGEPDVYQLDPWIATEGWEKEPLGLFRICAYEPEQKRFLCEPVEEGEEVKPRVKFLRALYHLSGITELTREDAAVLSQTPFYPTFKDAGDMVQPFVAALGRREENPEGLSRLLEVLAPKNPWAFDSTVIPLEDSDSSSSGHACGNVHTRRYLLRIMFQAANHGGLGSALQVYFNTPLRFRMYLQEALWLLHAQLGMNLETLPLWGDLYPLRLKRNPETGEPQGINFRSKADCLRIEGDDTWDTSTIFHMLRMEEYTLFVTKAEQ